MSTITSSSLPTFNSFEDETWLASRIRSTWQKYLSIPLRMKPVSVEGGTFYLVRLAFNSFEDETRAKALPGGSHYQMIFQFL